MMIPILGGRPGLAFTASKVAVTGDGNSLMYGDGSSGGQSLTVQLAKLPPINSRLAITNLGINGQRTTQMTASASDVNAAHQAGKTNILIVWEGVNDMLGGGVTAQQAYVNMRTYCQARLATNPENPWRILLLNLAPFYAGDQASQAGVITRNEQFAEFNDLLRDNKAAIGYEALVDVRQAGSPFAIPDYQVATFKDPSYQQYFNVEVNNKLLHFNNRGYAEIAKMVAATLRRLPTRTPT